MAARRTFPVDDGPRTRLPQPLSERPANRHVRAGLPPPAAGLYDPDHERDACGVGFIVDIKGRRSHKIVEQGLQILLNLLHRGACGCEVATGDGAGFLLQIPDRFLRKVTAPLGFRLPPEGTYGAGFVFLPHDDGVRERIRDLFAAVVREEGQRLLGWRCVPTDDHLLGASAVATEPRFEQVFIAAGAAFGTDDAAGRDRFERKLYVIRKRVEHAVDRMAMAEARAFYVPSLSSKTLIYKGMLIADQIVSMFPDLADPDVESALALVHQRFSTNTFPSWSLAHPYRYIAHNGEINTLRGNINWMRAREGLLDSPLFGDDLKKILPIIREGGSDTATFDNVLEFLVMGGRSLPHAILMMIPEPWSRHESMRPELKAFYEYHAALMEPWDGPASIAFTDGSVVGAVLDRNGLRPSRYVVTKDGLVVMASEVGVLDIPPENVLIKERLHPGRLFLVDTAQGRIVSDEEIKRELARAHPYAEWLAENMVAIEDLPDPPDLPPPRHETVLQRQQTFGYTDEDLRMLIAPMATSGQEPVGSMGNDTALAVLSESAAPAVRLLHAGVRAGHQPPARRDSRGAGDVDGIDDRSGRKFPRSPTRVVPPDQDQVSGHRQRPACEAAAPLLSRVQVPHAADDVCATRRGPGPRVRPRTAEGPGESGGGSRVQHPHPVRPEHRPRPGADPEPARDGGGPPSSRARGHAHEVCTHRRIRQCPRGAPPGAAPGLRRRRRQSLPGVRDAGRHDPARDAPGHHARTGGSRTISRPSTKAS